MKYENLRDGWCAPIPKLEASVFCSVDNGCSDVSFNDSPVG